MQTYLTLTILSMIVSTASDRIKLECDVVIRNALVFDGSGAVPYQADLAIRHDTIVAMGDLDQYVGKKEIDVTGLAIAPGFINMLSWADQTLLIDGRSLSDIKQGVTLEIFGEGFSPGPVKRSGKIKADSLWTSLDGYFKWAIKKGVSPNIASFVGATSVRMHVLDQDNRAPTRAELERMRSLVREAMDQGAMGLGSSLIYAPANYASAAELIALATEAGKFGGMYVTHLRSEGDFILQALEEAIRIGKEARVPVEIYHLKINIERNWSKLDKVIAKIDSARNAGIKVTANMYPYTASATGLTARLPTWALAGGGKALRKRLRNPSIKKRILYEMKTGIPYKNSDPSHVVITGFRLDSLNRRYRGKRLDEAARLHGKPVDETTLDLIVADRSRIECIYYLQSEDNLRKIMRIPYVSFGSDAGSMAPTKEFEAWSGHPRAYGTFARVLGKYVREEKIITLPDAIRKMTALPAENLRIKDRGRLLPGYFADVVVFDPQRIIDKATFENPQQFAEGVIHVFINGQQVLENGEHTNARPGRVVRGPGYRH